MSTTTAQELRAQAIDIGGHWFAFPLGWARSALERFELSSAPGAPAWLAGAANVEGEVVPVMDLALWLEPDRPAQRMDPAARDTRLLVGGQGESSLGLLFRGLPRLVRVTAASPEQAAQLPSALQGLCLGLSSDDATLCVLDGAALFERLLEQMEPGATP